MPVQDSGAREALSYTVPGDHRPRHRLRWYRRALTNYVFAHSKYSSGLGQRGVLADLLIDAMRGTAAS